jgi:hypothetical protein
MEHNVSAGYVSAFSSERETERERETFCWVPEKEQTSIIGSLKTETDPVSEKLRSLAVPDNGHSPKTQ